MPQPSPLPGSERRHQLTVLLLLHLPHPPFLTTDLEIRASIYNMKTGLILALGAISGLAQAAVHTVKLEKVPLSEQLEHADITTHAKSLYKKYSGQRFMGVRPDTHKEEMFRDTSIHLDKDDHAVPVSNFLNAQCPYRSFPLRFTL